MMNVDKQPPYEAIASNSALYKLYSEYIPQALIDGKDKHSNDVVEVDERMYSE